MKRRPMFVRFCQNPEPHTAHVYVKRWRLADLPLLRNPERYPAEWDARYSCPGLKLPGKTWAESLGLVIPDSAPGGQRIVSRVEIIRGGRLNRSRIDYDGHFDTDAYGRSDD